jgi:dTDP-4-amino-4,6-dideoxygalactose transaminase
MIIPFSPPDITEREINEIAEAMRSGWITTGSRTKLFEKKIAEFIHTSKAVCLNSATAALEMTLRILGIGPGDEVITSAYTYTASASVIHHIGAKIVLVDTAPESYEMDYARLANAITERTKAIIPVDVAGVMCDYQSIFKIVEAKKPLFQPANHYQSLFNRVIVIADAAHSFGAWQTIGGQKKMSGQVADFTCFSFHAVKNLTTAEGGAVTWLDVDGLDHAKLYQEFMLISLHGQTKDAFAKTKLGAWEYDIMYPAYKCNMTDLTAAFGLIQLERYPDMLRRRQELVSIYNQKLSQSRLEILNHFSPGFCSSMHLYLVRIPNCNAMMRHKIIEEMTEHDISVNVHYKPLPMLTAYKNLGFDIQDYPNSYNQYRNEISIPLHTKLSNQDVEFVSETLLNATIEFRR